MVEILECYKPGALSSGESDLEIISTKPRWLRQTNRRSSRKQTAPVVIDDSDSSETIGGDDYDSLSDCLQVETSATAQTDNSYAFSSSRPAVDIQSYGESLGIG